MLPIKNVDAADTPPFATGFDTLMLALPILVISPAVIAACKLVLETNVVVRALPFHCTVEEGTKLVPVMVNVKPAPPAGAELGFSDAIVGAFTASVAGGAGVGGGVNVEGGAGLTKLPPTR